MKHTPPYILLVEDNQDDIDLTLRVLCNQGFIDHIEVATDGAEALAILFDRERPLPELILLDLNLPKIGGNEVLRRLRQDERTRYLPVVMLTTSRQESDVAESYLGGANSYVRKPVDFGEFSTAVREIGVYWLLRNVKVVPH